MIPPTASKNKRPVFRVFFSFVREPEVNSCYRIEKLRAELNTLLRLSLFIRIFPGKDIDFTYSERGVRRRSGMNFRGDLGKTAIEVYSILD